MEGDRAAWLVLVLVMVTLFVASMISQSLPTGVVLAALLALATWRLWLPTRFEISAAGITQHALRRSRRLAWHEIAEVERRPAGVLVRPAVEEPAIYFPYRQHKADVLALLDFYRGN
jgi:hypothetical protein